MNRIYNNKTSNDVLSEFDENRIYVSEDGRKDINDSRCTTVSAVKYLGGDRYLQTVHHQPGNNTRSVIFKKKYSTYTIVGNNKKLLNYLKSGIWRWYFE